MSTSRVTPQKGRLGADAFDSSEAALTLPSPRPPLRGAVERTTCGACI